MRRASRVVLAALAALLGARAACAQTGFEAPPYPNAGVAVTDDASGLFVNPAAAGRRAGSELWLSADGAPGPGNGPLANPTARGALSFGSSGGLFGTVPYKGRLSWGTSFGFGQPALRAGASLRSLTAATAGAAFPAGRPPGDDRTPDWSVGLLSRPVSWASLGAVADHVGRPELSGARLDRLWTFGAGLRPLAWIHGRRDADRITLSADVGMREGAPSSAARVRVGADLEIAPGVVLRGAAEDHGGVRLGITLRGQNSAVHGAHYSPARGEDAASIGASFHAAEEPRPLSAPARVARIRADGILADESLTSVSVFDQSSTGQVRVLREQLERASRDPHTRGVLLDIGGGVAGMAQIEELRPRIAALRTGGKPVVAYLETGGTRSALYLATACDRIVASPESFWAALGLHGERRYYRKALADLGVRIDRTSYGKYKSAYRNFSVDSTSGPDRESIERSLDVVQALSVGAIAKDRRLPEDRLLEVMDGRAWRAEDLVKLGIIDSVGYRENALRMLGTLAHLGTSPRVVNLARTPEVTPEWRVSHAIAIVYASGEIETGASGNDLLNGAYMGSSTMVRQIDAAFRNPEVRAVVLRIDSPGGSSVGSDLISHAAARMKRETGKPLIVSMARVAASGGYHIAIAGDKIYADRLTITGSIGVLSVRYSLEGWLRKHQIRQDDFDRGAFMRAWSTGHDWDAREQAAADSATYADYRAFVDVVARARGMSWDEVDAVAQGRVWYGEDARDRKLIDAIGSLDDAIAEARRRAGIPPDAYVEPVEYRRPSSSFLQRALGTWVRSEWQQSVHLPDPGETRFGMDPDMPMIE